VSTTSLAGVAAYLPETSRSVEEVAGFFGLGEREVRRYRRFFGLDSVRWAPAARQADLLTAAAGRLPDLAAHAHRIRYVLHARTIEPAAPYPVSPLHDTVRRLGLEHAVAFAVSQHACASGLLAVELAGRLLAAAGDADGLVLVLAGEKTYRHVSTYMPAVAVMGEAGAACLVGLDGPRDRLVAYATRTYGTYHDVTAQDRDLAGRFQAMYPEALADLIRAALAQARLDLADLGLILPHNVNRISWTRLCQLLDLPFERVVLDTIPITGHCFCADPFLNYVHARDHGRLRSGDYYLMVSVGLGATFSAMLFRH
jgi:3-oxoacyl-[acyl-carrier-protein] synthase III